MTALLERYRGQSRRYLDGAVTHMRLGRWDRAADLLWGSLVAALKAVATARGEALATEADARAYAAALARELSDRYVREAFAQVARLRDSILEVRESRRPMDHLHLMAEDVATAVERLWALLPQDGTGPPPRGQRGRR